MSVYQDFPLIEVHDTDDSTNSSCLSIFSTHVLDVVEKLCDKVSIIKQGKLIISGNIETVRGFESLENVFMEVAENEK